MAWTAFAQITRNDDGLFNVYCPTVGSTEEEARAAAEFVLKALAEGKFHFVRKAPTVGSEQSYETKAVEHKGIVRFGFKDEPGEEHVPTNRDDQMIGFGKQILDRRSDVTVEIQPLAVEGEVQS